ncbi:MAG: GDP-mannose 4,6-dehydratase [bacterium]
MTEKVLITGVSGFVGRHLASLLVREGYEVAGMAPDIEKGWEGDSQELRSVQALVADLSNELALRGVLERTRPRYIYHLAAQSHVPTSWKRPRHTFETNVLGTLDLFEAVYDMKLDCRILSVCTGDAYGVVDEADQPIKETQPLSPRNPYASSKATQDLLSQQYAASPGLDVIVTRSFSHTGPGQSDQFVCSAFARQLVEIELGKREREVSVGNLKPQRDFLDVRDVVRAYHLAMHKGEKGAVYNIASGVARSIESILEMLLALAKVTVAIRRDEERYRATDSMVVRGDATKFRQRTGWKPEISWEKTLGDLLDYWRKRLGEK